jgi:hypothetical protein
VTYLHIRDKFRDFGCHLLAEAKAANESGIGDEAAPLLADEGGMWKGGRLRGKAEEDLGKQVVVFQRRRRWAIEAPHLALSSRLNFRSS